MIRCARTNTIAALLAGAVDRAAAERLEVHLDQCPSCRRLVADLGRGLSAIGGDTKPVTEPLPRPGESLGRYELRRVIGVGGMGVVYEAHDTTLDRRVALKLLRPDLLDGPSLLAEAQAMARLQHPNIVTVHDAGITNGQLHICMEYVAGSTLRAWIAEQRRDWRAIVDVFIAAGEGLAYVHRAGLVHLDFKPDNVLVDRDGRVRVTDFGVARIVGARPRMIVGTPAYMPPEQRRGGTTDARSDQYAFCVSLREALGDAPRSLRRLLARGLAEHPGDRFATMDELLAALAAARLSPRRRRASALAVIGMVTVAALAVSVMPNAPRVVPWILERPIAHDVTTYRDVIVREPPPLEPAATPVVAERRTVATVQRAAHTFVPPRRAPVLHVEPILLAEVATSSSTTSTDATASSGACDDGSELSCPWYPPSCPSGTMITIQQGCWTCAEIQTCTVLGFPRTCNDGSPLRCTQAAPTCAPGRVAAVRNGCWSCEDPFTCSSWTRPTQAPPRQPPPRPGIHNGSNEGSNGGSNAGSNAGSNGGSNDGSPHCGNGFCEVGETHASCASDCCETDAWGACAAVCGNGFCERGEDHASCAGDCCELSPSGACAPVCGNGFCEEGEVGCPSDC